MATIRAARLKHESRGGAERPSPPRRSLSQMPTLAAPASAACWMVAPFRNAMAMATDMVSMASARSCP